MSLHSSQTRQVYIRSVRPSRSRGIVSNIPTDTWHQGWTSPRLRWTPASANAAQEERERDPSSEQCAFGGMTARDMGWP